jgi:peptidoglycan/LPS O-acetylase OafA/YrhL
VIGALTYTPLHLLWDGQEAVILFFVLSGFVLALPTFNGKGAFYPSYLVRRFFRIYVPYLVVVSFSAVLLLFSLSKHPMPGTSDWFALMWTHALHPQEYLNDIFMRVRQLDNVDGPAWSLSYEMRISIFFPLICLAVLGLPGWIAAGLGAFLSVAGLLALDHFPYFPALTLTVYYSSFFIFGCVLAKYQREVKLFLEKFRNWQRGCLILAALGLYNLAWEMGGLARWGWSFPHDHILVALAPGIASVLLISSALAFEKLQEALHHKILLWVGKISYSLYLTHLVLLAAAVYFLPPAIPLLGRVLLGACLTFPTAALSYQFLELPCIHLGHFLAKKLDGKRRLELEKIQAGPLRGES